MSRAVATKIEEGCVRLYVGRGARETSSGCRETATCAHYCKLVLTPGSPVLRDCAGPLQLSLFMRRSGERPKQRHCYIFAVRARIARPLIGCCYQVNYHVRYLSLGVAYTIKRVPHPGDYLGM
jgi:hypothetical protein